MFTVLSNTRNSNLYVIAALAIMIVVLMTFALAPAISAPEPIFIPVARVSEAGSDYYERHPELRVAGPILADTTADFYLRHREWVIAPAPVSSEASDYFQRHPELSLPTVNPVDTTGDFYLRHPAWMLEIPSAAIPVTGVAEMSDYFQRHPELVLPAGITVDTTDYFARHPELRQPVDPSDYFLRHPELRTR